MKSATLDADNGLRVLLTNRALANRAGTEMYVHDVAQELQRRGHHPMVYSPILGEVAEAIRSSTVPVVDDMSAFGEAPDIIHGHHHIETATALARFPCCPAIYVCHGWRPWEEMPLVLPRIRRYVCVDEVTRERLVFEHGIPLSRVVMIPNFADLRRFPPRSPLPRKARRVLLYSNYATPGSQYHQAATEACERAGMSLDVVGIGFGRVTDDPGRLMAHYDIVLAQGRSAIEAMVVGAMVIICSSRNFGPPVESNQFEKLRLLNFGIRTQNLPVDIDVLHKHLLRYDAKDASAVSARMREEASLELAVERLLQIYGEALGALEPPHPTQGDSIALTSYLTQLSRRFQDIPRLANRCSTLEEQATTLSNEVASLQTHAASLEAQLDRMRTTGTWKLREFLLRFRVVRYGQQTLQKLIRCLMATRK